MARGLTSKSQVYAKSTRPLMCLLGVQKPALGYEKSQEPAKMWALAQGELDSPIPWGCQAPMPRATITDSLLGSKHADKFRV